MEGSVIEYQDKVTGWIALDKEMLQELNEGWTVSARGCFPDEGIIFLAKGTKQVHALLNAWSLNALLLPSFHPAGPHRWM